MLWQRQPNSSGKYLSLPKGDSMDYIEDGDLAYDGGDIADLEADYGLDDIGIDFELSGSILGLRLA